MRTSSDKLYRPIRRITSRYGLIEQALMKLQNEGKSFATSQEIAHMTKRMRTNSVAGILKFTEGVCRDGRTWVFTGEPIRVVNRSE